METQLSLGQAVALIGAIVGPLLTGLSVVFLQMRAASNKTIEVLEGALVKSENQAETLLPALQQQVVAVNTTLTLLRRDIEEGRVEQRAVREDARLLREDARILREEVRQLRESLGGQGRR